MSQNVAEVQCSDDICWSLNVLLTLGSFVISRIGVWTPPPDQGPIEPRLFTCGRVQPHVGRCEWMQSISWFNSSVVILVPLKVFDSWLPCQEVLCILLVSSGQTGTGSPVTWTMGQSGHIMISRMWCHTEEATKMICLFEYVCESWNLCVKCVPKDWQPATTWI